MSIQTIGIFNNFKKSQNLLVTIQSDKCSQVKKDRHSLPSGDKRVKNIEAVFAERRSVTFNNSENAVAVSRPKTT